MPADLLSTILQIMLTAAESVAHLWPYVAGGVAVAALLSRLIQGRQGAMPLWLPRNWLTPVAAIAGVGSPLPTASAIPLVLRLREEGLPGRAALTFALASSLLNPQLFVLTLGALGALFALAQVVAVLLLSIGLGMVFGSPVFRSSSPEERADGLDASRTTVQILELAGHVGFYFLLGVLAGASFQVLLPRLGVVGWLDRQGWLASPFLSWLAAPFYTCGGTAVPLARSLGQTGFGPGPLFTFLLVGPALRGTSVANLAVLLPRRALIACIIALLAAGGLLGLGYHWLVEMIG